MKKILALFTTLILLIGTLAGCGNDNEDIYSEVPPKEVTLSTADFIGKGYYDVWNLFDEYGFTNVYTEALDDLTSAEKDKDDIVQKVTIDGGETYEAGTVYMSNVEVKIYYHNIKTVYAPFSSEQRPEDELYDSIKKQFEEAGFTNVKGEPIEDLVFGWLTEDGEIDSITINGNDTFDDYTSFAFDSEVVIKYHTFPQGSEDTNGTDKNDSSTKLHPPYNTDSAEGLKYTDVVQAFKDAGFTNITTEKRYEAAFWGYEADTVANIYINNSGIHTDWTYDADAEVRIDYYVISDGSKSDTELSQYYAQKAFEEYGEAKYPFGFKCHWILDLINAEQYDDGSWFFKVGVTITTIYGTEYDTIAEGKISGSDANPVVTQFYVSN